MRHDDLKIRWGKAVERRSSDPETLLMQFRDARWSLPELDTFFREAQDVSWGAGRCPWSFAFTVAQSLFVHRVQPCSDGHTYDEALCAACLSLVPDLPPNPGSAQSTLGICSAVRVTPNDFADVYQGFVKFISMNKPLALVMTRGRELRIVQGYNYTDREIHLHECTPTGLHPKTLCPNCLASLQYRVHSPEGLSRGGTPMSEVQEGGCAVCRP